VKKNKISFDFDECLEFDYMQNFAKDLSSLGYEIWIVTARWSTEMYHKVHYPLTFPTYNKDLYEIAKKLNIPNEHIIFTNMEIKWLSIKDKGFILHMDNDNVEVDDINEFTDVKAVMSLAPNSIETALKILENGKN